MSKIILGYWDVRGRAEPARMMLEFGGLDWEDKRYSLSGPPDFDRGGWPEEKPNMNLDFPNLPYLIDSDVRITESWAIYIMPISVTGFNCRYFGTSRVKSCWIQRQRKLSMQPTCLLVILDAVMKIGELCYNPDFDNLKTPTREKLEAKMAEFEKFLDGRCYLTGSTLSFVDFTFFEAMDVYRLVYPGIFDKFPSIKGFLERFESVERIAAYLKSERYYKYPIYSPFAKWGGKKQ